MIQWSAPFCFTIVTQIEHDTVRKEHQIHQFFKAECLIPIAFMLSDPFLVTLVYKLHSAWFIRVTIYKGH